MEISVTLTCYYVTTQRPLGIVRNFLKLQQKSVNGYGRTRSVSLCVGSTDLTEVRLHFSVYKYTEVFTECVK